MSLRQAEKHLLDKTDPAKQPITVQRNTPNQSSSASGLDLNRAEDLAKIMAHPVTFAQKILNLQLSPEQIEILTTLITHYRVAVKSCHSAGKTMLAAIAALWWITRYKNGIAITTAPTWIQVEEIIWQQIHALIADAKIKYPEPLQSALRLGPQRYAMGLSTDQGVRFQGFHGRVLILIDEAVGVRADIYEAIEGIRAGGEVRVLALANPTISSGPFYDAFTSQRSNWQTFTLDAFETPNLKPLGLKSDLDVPRILGALTDEELDDNPFPHFTSKRWVLEKYQDWGPAHPLWKSKVRAEFADVIDPVIPLAWVEAACARHDAWLKDRKSTTPPFTCVGVDVGRGGNKSVQAKRHAEIITELERDQKPDTMDLAGRVANLLNSRTGYAVIDVIGVGAGVYDRLREQRLPVIAFNAGAATDALDLSGAVGFVNQRSAVWWYLRERLDPNTPEPPLLLPNDDTLIGDLTAPQYRYTSTGKISIESKDDIHDRLGRSTDDGDAVCMAFAIGARPRKRKAKPATRGHRASTKQMSQTLARFG